MTEAFVLTAEPRSDMGKGASRRLRRQGKVPAVLYGAGKEPTALSLDHNALLKQLENEAFFSHILTVKFGDKQEEQAIVKDLQRHPARPVIMHMDLQRVSATTRIRVLVPLHFVNEDSCPGIKAGGVATHNITEVEVSCLPKDLPEFIEVDMRIAQLDQALHLSDLKLPAGVELPELQLGPAHDLPVVSVHLARGAQVEEGPAEGEEGAA